MDISSLWRGVLCPRVFPPLSLFPPSTCHCLVFTASTPASHSSFPLPSFFLALPRCVAFSSLLLPSRLFLCCSQPSSSAFLTAFRLLPYLSLFSAMSDTAVAPAGDDLALGAGDDGRTKADLEAGDALADPEADEFSLSLTSRKKKKTKKTKATEDSTDPSTSTSLTSSSATSTSTSSSSSSSTSTSTVGVLPSSATGPERDYNYTELLERVFSLLHEKNPALSTRKRYTMPPPQLVRVGTRKTMWTNFAQNCSLMHRQPEHVMSFLLAELGTDGSIDGNQRLVIKGRYQPKQVESLLKKYIMEYVSCSMCRNPETSLTRDSVTRLYFIQCESCGSRRSVAPIKSGFHATMRAERRKAMDN